jgi:hypothetical protein
VQALEKEWLRVAVHRLGSGPAAAVAPTSDERVEAGDQGPDLPGQTSNLVCQGTLALDQAVLALDQEALAFNLKALTFDDCVQHLLDFEVLLADAEVELGEALLLKPIPLSQQAYHLFARLASWQAPEAGDQRGFEIAEPFAHLTLEVGKSLSHLALEVGEPCPHLAFEIGEPDSKVLVQRLQGDLVSVALGHGFQRPTYHVGATEVRVSIETRAGAGEPSSREIPRVRHFQSDAGRR